MQQIYRRTPMVVLLVKTLFSQFHQHEKNPAFLNHLDRHFSPILCNLPKNAFQIVINFFANDKKLIKVIVSRMLGSVILTLPTQSTSNQVNKPDSFSLIANIKYQCFRRIILDIVATMEEQTFFILVIPLWFDSFYWKSHNLFFGP